MTTPIEDLKNSGLNDDTIRAMRIRERSRNDLKVMGYHKAEAAYDIPYFDIQNRALSFYRIKLLPAVLTTSGKAIKYIQQKSSETHAYLPPIIPPEQWLNPHAPIIITEGEKKAAKACQEGILTIGLGGVNAWKHKVLEFDIEDAKKTPQGKGSIQIEDLEKAKSVEEGIVEELARIPWDGRRVFICFDSDNATNESVQLAAFELSAWLEGEGALPCQIILPSTPSGGKQGLDDFLIHHTPDEFWELDQTLAQHPRARSFVAKTMDKGRTKRSDQLKCTTAILNGLDANGRRYVNPLTGDHYYWDNNLHVLHEFNLGDRNLGLTSFGMMLNQRYGVSDADNQLRTRITSGYASRPGMGKVYPKKVCHATDDAFYFQLSDSFLLKTTKDFIEVANNGTDGVLFLANQVEPIPIEEVLYQPKPGEGGFTQVYKAPPTDEPRWLTTLRGVNLQPLPFLNAEETRVLIAGLFYLNPWFRRWRGLMLPLELMIGEAGSGKSFLYNLRQAILTGRPSLNNPPVSHKDWNSQIASAGALWVCDNLGQPVKELADHMSDELARLITDPTPKIDVRKLYTTMEMGSFPVNCSFAITAIRNPFHKADIMQRSLIIPLAAIEEGQRDSRWYMRQLECGGRTQWILEQARIAQRFLRAAHMNWQENYLSSNRLVHLEQCLLFMGEAMGTQKAMAKVVSRLTDIINSQIASGDPLMEALQTFALEHLAKSSQPYKPFKASDIVNWAGADPESRYDHIRVLKNPISIGKYLAQHAHDVANIAGISPGQVRHNQTFYQLIDKSTK